MAIRQRVNPSGKIVYQLDLGKGKGGRRTFGTRRKAEEALRDEMEKRSRHGRMADGISAQEMAELVTGFHRLKAVGTSVSEAVEFYLGNAQRLQEPLKLVELMKRFRDDRDKRDLSAKYVQQLKVPFDSLARMFPLALAHELTAKDIGRWIASGSWAAKTRNNYLGDVSAMFEWAILPTQGHARVNPCVGVEREPDKRRGIVSTLALAQCEELLQAAVALEEWRVLTYVALGLFGGLRPEEAAYQGLVWGDIDLQEKTVRLSEDVVKTGAGRVVDLSEGAVAWLSLVPVDRRAGPVVFTPGWLEKWRRFRHTLGWQVIQEKTIKRRCYVRREAVHGPWPNDVLRHTYASMHYAQHQNEALLQVQMGHRSARMIHAHYRAVKTRAEAAAFWALWPAGELRAAPLTVVDDG